MCHEACGFILHFHLQINEFDLYYNCMLASKVSIGWCLSSGLKVIRLHAYNMNVECTCARKTIAYVKSSEVLFI